MKFYALIQKLKKKKQELLSKSLLVYIQKHIFLIHSKQIMAMNSLIIQSKKYVINLQSFK